MSCYSYNIFSILYLFKNFLIKNNKIYKELYENAQVIILGGSGDAAYRK
jgi:hypothetical protein